MYLGREHWTGEMSADGWVQFFLFLIGHWYYEKNIFFWQKQPILAGAHL